MYLEDTIIINQFEYTVHVHVHLAFVCTRHYTVHVYVHVYTSSSPCTCALECILYLHSFVDQYTCIYMYMFMYTHHVHLAFVCTHHYTVYTSSSPCTCALECILYLHSFVDTSIHVYTCTCTSVVLIHVHVHVPVQFIFTFLLIDIYMLCVTELCVAFFMYMYNLSYYMNICCPNSCTCTIYFYIFTNCYVHVMCN